MLLLTLLRVFADFYLLVSDIRMNVTDFPLCVFLICSNKEYAAGSDFQNL